MSKLRSTTHERLSTMRDARATRVISPLEESNAWAAGKRMDDMRHRLTRALIRKGWYISDAVDFAGANEYADMRA